MFGDGRSEELESFIYSGGVESRDQEEAKAYVKALVLVQSYWLFYLFFGLIQYEQTNPLENYRGPAISFFCKKKKIQYII